MPRREEVVLSKYNIFETDEFQKQLKKITSVKRKVIETNYRSTYVPNSSQPFTTGTMWQELCPTQVLACSVLAKRYRQSIAYCGQFAQT